MSGAAFAEAPGSTRAVKERAVAPRSARRVALAEERRVGAGDV